MKKVKLNLYIFKKKLKGISLKEIKKKRFCFFFKLDIKYATNIVKN